MLEYEHTYTVLLYNDWRPSSDVRRLSEGVHGAELHNSLGPRPMSEHAEHDRLEGAGRTSCAHTKRERVHVPLFQGPLERTKRVRVHRVSIRFGI